MTRSYNNMHVEIFKSQIFTYLSIVLQIKSNTENIFGYEMFFSVVLPIEMNSYMDIKCL